MSAALRSRETWIDVVLWAATFVCVVLTLYWSLLAAPPEGHLFKNIDKVQHWLAYYTTALLLLLAAVWRPGRGDGLFARWEAYLLVLLIAAGAGIEVLQSFIGRDADLGDWLVEILAVALAWGTVAALRAWVGRRAAPPVR